MPRKTRGFRGARDSVQSPYRQREVIYQCLECGARADPLYGLGDQSWCPHCGLAGTVIGEEGKFPLPHLYEQWRRNQKRKAQQAQDEEIDVVTLPRLAAPKKAAMMRSVKTHTGTFYCPQCWVEGELYAQESLKCGRCGALLKRGHLDDVSPPASGAAP